jgi:hypothetical protein
MCLEKINLSYNAYALPESWRMFIKTISVICHKSLIEIDLQDCKLLNSQAIAICDGFEDAIQIYQKYLL